MYLLTRNDKINDEEKRVVFGIYDKESTNVPAALLMRSRELFSYYASRADLKIAVKGEDTPVIVTDSKQSMINCEAVYRYVGQYRNEDGTLPQNVTNLIFNKLIPPLTGYIGDQATAKDVLIATMQFASSDLDDGAAMKVSDLDNFNVEQLYTATSNIVMQEYASRDIARDTDTLFQNSCTDTLSLRLPTSSQLASEEYELEDLVPKRDEVCVPYQNRMAYTSSYKRAGSGVPQSMYPLIEGDSRNNELPIQENEEAFYEKMIKWMRANIAAEFGPESLNSDDRHIVLDTTTEQYFNAMFAAIYSWHWGHNPNVPTYLPDEDDDEFADSNAESKYVFSAAAGEERDLYVPAFLPLQNFIQQAAMELGYKVYAEAVIKLCRWGTRKPTALYFDGYPYIFDLGKNITEAYAGKISDYIQCEDENGCNMRLKGAITCNSRIIDTKYMESMGYTLNSFPVPVGLVFTQIYTNRKNPNKKIQLDSYYSMFDVVDCLFNQGEEPAPNFKPVGFSVHDGQITAPQLPDHVHSIGALREKYNGEKATAIANPFYCSPALQDLLIELNTAESNRDLNQFSIIDNGVQTANLEEVMQENSFSTLQELAKKFSDCMIASHESAISVNVFKVLLPMLLEVNKKFAGNTEYSLTDVLNAYKDAMVDSGYVDEAGFYKERKQHPLPFYERAGIQRVGKQVTAKEQTKPAEEISDMDAFSSKPTVVPGNGNPLVEPVPAPSFVTTVYWKQKTDRIGYCTLRKFKANGKVCTEIILLDKNYPESHPDVQVMKCANFMQIAALMLSDLLTLSKGGNTFKVKAESEECLKYYVDLYSSLTTKER